MLNGAGRALLVVIAAAMAALTLSVGTDARAASERVHASTVPQGVLIRVFSDRARAVDFTLAGRRLARRHRAPYSILVRGHRLAGRSARLGKWVVARDRRSGRRLARVRVAKKRSQRPPSTGITAPSPPIDAPLPSLPPTPSPSGVAAPPAPPSPYSIPPDAVTVSTSAGLDNALAAEHPTDIVLEDGVYDRSEPFLNAFGHRVYAARLGGAVLRAGFVLGDNWGVGNGLLRGLAFDVDDPAKTLHGDLVHVWGTAQGSRLLDLTLDGHKRIEAGIKVRQPEGVVIQRVVARNFTDWGVAIDANILGHTVGRPPLVEDVVATDVGWAVPAASNGRSEACVWIGNTAVVRRIFAARCAWEGLWTGTAARAALFEDIRVDESGVGIYAEHFNSAGTTFRRLEIGPSVRTGVNCEWADPGWGGIPGCTDVLVEDSVFDTSLVGVYLDEGTTRTTIRDSVFRNQRWAAIGDHQGNGNAYHANDVSGLPAGAVPLSHDHLFEHCDCTSVLGFG